MQKMTFLFGAACAAFSFFSAAEARTWTDIKGRTIEAEMLGKSAKAVKVRLKGKETTIPLSKLSAKDQDFVKNWEPDAQDETSQSQEADLDEEKYFNLPWPKLVTVPPKLEIEEEVKDGSYIYRSENYEFISDARLSKVPVMRFAVLFEATRKYVQQLPYASMKAYKKGHKHKVMLFEKDENYFRAGAPKGSAGVYLPSKDIIMVKFTSLGLIKRGKGYALDYDRSNKTLPHEITHQLTDWDYFVRGAQGWFTEGFAEYVAVTPYRSGKFTVNKAPAAIEQYTTSYSRKDNRGRAIGTDVQVGSLKEFMLMPYRSFAGENANFNYAVGALLVTYFNHYDGEGDAANLKNFLRALKAGKKGEEALEVLLAGRTFAELEKNISKEWRSRGVRLRFE